MTRSARGTHVQFTKVTVEDITDSSMRVTYQLKMHDSKLGQGR